MPSESIKPPPAPSAAPIRHAWDMDVASDSAGGANDSAGASKQFAVTVVYNRSSLNTTPTKPMPAKRASPITRSAESAKVIHKWLVQDDQDKNTNTKLRINEIDRRKAGLLHGAAPRHAREQQFQTLNTANTPKILPPEERVHRAIEFTREY
ncbi:hypothetical protein HDV05_000354, partial [Chytridiales sp. JEL 0842]